MAKNFKELQAKLPKGPDFQLRPERGEVEISVADTVRRSGEAPIKVLALTAKDERAAELLGDIYRFWEEQSGRDTIDLASVGPVGAALAEQLWITVTGKLGGRRKGKSRE